MDFKRVFGRRNISFEESIQSEIVKKIGGKEEF